MTDDSLPNKATREWPSDEDTSAPDTFNIQISRDMIRSAVLDALRLDYAGDLATLCQSAVKKAEPDLQAMIVSTVSDVASDPEFRASLKDAIRQRIIRTAQDRVERLVKKMSVDELKKIAEVDT